MIYEATILSILKGNSYLQCGIPIGRQVEAAKFIWQALRAQSIEEFVHERNKLLFCFKEDDPEAANDLIRDIATRVMENNALVFLNDLLPGKYTRDYTASKDTDLCVAER